MSCFVVEPKTINKVVTAIRNDRWHPEEFGDLSDEKNCQALVDRMLAMNRQAYTDRYNDPIGFEISYSFRNERSTRVGAYKALRCYLYQCAEGDVPEQALFKQLEKLSGWWAHSIVESLPEYCDS